MIVWPGLVGLMCFEIFILITHRLTFDFAFSFFLRLYRKDFFVIVVWGDKEERKGRGLGKGQGGKDWGARRLTLISCLLHFTLRPSGSLPSSARLYNLVMQVILRLQLLVICVFMWSNNEDLFRYSGNRSFCVAIGNCKESMFNKDLVTVSIKGFLYSNTDFSNG